MLKIAIWGISEYLVRTVCNSIDPTKAEIVVFIDSDPEKWGKCYMDVQVVSPDMFNSDRVDEIIIVALSAYKNIKESLVNKAVAENKIHPFITSDLPRYCVGEIGQQEIELLKEIYFDPNWLMQYVETYKEQYNNYVNCVPYVENSDEWFQKADLIAHACGGIVNGQELTYTDSKEALEYSLSHGYKLIECDIIGIDWREPFLSHDFWNIYRAKEMKYTLMSVRDMFKIIQKYPDTNILIDIKWRCDDEYERYVEHIENAIEEIDLTYHEKQQLKEQIILEVYNEKTIKIAYQKGYKMFFTQYQNNDRVYHMHTVNLCFKYGIKVIGMDYRDFECANSISKFLPIYHEKNIKIFVYNTNSVDEYKYLKSLGIKGVFTSFISVEDDKRLKI